MDAAFQRVGGQIFKSSLSDGMKHGLICVLSALRGKILVAAALFVFLAAAAGAGVVRADLDLLDDGLTLDGLVAAAALAGDLRDALALDLLVRA